MKKLFTASVSSLIGFLVLIFIVLPLAFGGLARHYIHTALKTWVKNHPGGIYQFKTLNRGIFSSTQEIQIGFDQNHLFTFPFTLSYGPIIFDQGIHVGFARIHEETTQLGGIPPTTYSGSVGILGGVTLFTHTPKPTQLLNLMKLILQSNISFSMESIDTEIHSRLTSQSMSFALSINQLIFATPPLSMQANKIQVQIDDFEHIHGDPRAMLSLNIDGLTYTDGFNHLSGSFSASNYEFLGSRMAAFNQLRNKIQAAGKDSEKESELSRQAVEMLLLGISHLSSLNLSASDSTPMGSASLNLSMSFPGLPDTPTPNEIIKHLEYNSNFGLPELQYSHSEDPGFSLLVKKLSILDQNKTSQIYLPFFSVKAEEKNLFLSEGFHLKSTESGKIFSKEKGQILDVSLDNLCIHDFCIKGLSLSNELQGINKNALLDAKGDQLVDILALALFKTLPSQGETLKFKSLVTPSTEDTLTVHGQLPHGSGSLDFNAKTPNLSVKKPFSQNVMLSLSLNLPSADVLTILGSTATTTNSPYDIPDTHRLTLLNQLAIIRNQWISAGFIVQENASDLLIADYSFDEGFKLNHRLFSELNQASAYAILGDFDGALDLLNKPEYQKNPTAEKMKADIAKIQQTITQEEVISNLPESKGSAQNSDSDSPSPPEGEED